MIITKEEIKATAMRCASDYKMQREYEEKLNKEHQLSEWRRKCKESFEVGKYISEKLNNLSQERITGK